MTEWLATLTVQQSSFFGALAGSSLGLVALLLGALLNAHLNRRRDDRLRNEEGWRIAAALHVELAAIATSFRKNIVGLQDPSGTDFFGPDPAQLVKVFPAVVDKIALLEPSAASKVINVYSVLDQVAEMILTMASGASIVPGMPRGRAVLLVSMKHAEGVRKLLAGVATDIEEACTIVRSTLPTRLRESLEA